MSDFNNMYYGEGTQVDEGRTAAYLSRVMGWMSLGLLTTFAAALVCLASNGFVYALATNQFLLYGILAAELIVVVVMNAMVNKIGPAAATVMFMVYSALTGVTMSVLCLIFAAASIFLVFALTAAVFLTMALYGFITKRDMTRFGALAVFGLIGLIFAGVVNIFLASPMMDFIICLVGVALFIGLTAYDTQKIKAVYMRTAEAGYDDGSAQVRKTAIYGALTLYLDFINLFFMLLRLIGKRR